MLRHTPCIVTFGMSRLSSVNSWSRDFGCCWLATDILASRLVRAVVLTAIEGVGVKIDGMAVVPTALWTLADSDAELNLCTCEFVTIISELRLISLCGSGTIGVRIEVMMSGFNCDRPSRDKLSTGRASRDRESTVTVSQQSSTASLHSCKTAHNHRHRHQTAQTAQWHDEPSTKTT